MHDCLRRTYYPHIPTTPHPKDLVTFSSNNCRPSLFAFPSMSSGSQRPTTSSRKSCKKRRRARSLSSVRSGSENGLEGGGSLSSIASKVRRIFLFCGRA